MNAITPSRDDLEALGLDPDDDLDAGRGARRGGRSGNSTNYNPAEHKVLLVAIKSIDGSYAAPEKSQLLQQVIDKMKIEMPSYNRTAITIHGHMTEMKRGIRSAVSNLSSKTPPILAPEYSDQLMGSLWDSSDSNPRAKEYRAHVTIPTWLLHHNDLNKAAIARKFGFI